MTVLVVGGIFREILDGDTTPTVRMGGSGLTAAIVAARLGADVALVSYVGSEDARAVGAMLDTAGVDRGSVLTLPGASGTFVFPTEGVESDRPWPMYRPAEAVPSSVPTLHDRDVILVFGLPDFDPIAAGWLDGLSEESILMWDQQGWMSRARDSRAAAALAPRSKLYLANLHEAREEFPAESAEATLLLLPPDGYHSAVIKQGADGCIVIRTEGAARVVQQIPGFGVAATSTIGSGDAFAGALAATLPDLDVADAARTANATAAAFLACGGDPLDPSLLDRQRDLLVASGL